MLIASGLKGKGQIENGDGYASGGTVPQVDGEESHCEVSEDFLQTVPLVRKHPRPLIDFYFESKENDWIYKLNFSVIFLKSMSFEIEFFIMFADLSNWFAGISRGNRVSGDILRHHRPRTDNRKIADGDSRQYDCTGSDPCAIANRNREGIHTAFRPLFRINRVPRGTERHIGSE